MNTEFLHKRKILCFAAVLAVAVLAIFCAIWFGWREKIKWIVQVERLQAKAAVITPYKLDFAPDVSPSIPVPYGLASPQFILKPNNIVLSKNSLAWWVEGKGWSVAFFPPHELPTVEAPSSFRPTYDSSVKILTQRELRLWELFQMSCDQLSLYHAQLVLKIGTPRSNWETAYFSFPQLKGIVRHITDQRVQIEAWDSPQQYKQLIGLYSEDSSAVEEILETFLSGYCFVINGPDEICYETVYSRLAAICAGDSSQDVPTLSVEE